MHTNDMYYLGKDTSNYPKRKERKTERKKREKKGGKKEGIKDRVLSPPVVMESMYEPLLVDRS